MNKLNVCILVMFLSFISMETFSASDNSTISLNGKWNLSYWRQPEQPIVAPEEMKDATINTIEATVPGNVELDLLSAGLIEMIYANGKNINGAIRNRLLLRK